MDVFQPFKTSDLATGRESMVELPRARVGMLTFGRLSFSHDGKRLAALCFLGEVRIFDAESGHEVSPPLKSFMYNRIEFSPDGKRLATGQPNGQVKVWDLTTGQETLVLKHTGAGQLDQFVAGYDIR